MSDLAIRAEGLGKRYTIGTAAARNDTLRDALAHSIRSPMRALRRRAVTDANSVWALRDVSFDVRQGEVLGIVGRNGAGKSTLLKVLSRITEPTAGRARIVGRVGSLLEVGTGFHPELTGRENVFLNGSILGMDRAYIERTFDEIVEFAGVGRFVDTPVKRYSSGMYLRLAFAVAAHLEPEILIVDEVLAVGDAQFQKKCLGKLAEVTSHGRTVLFVSHNMAAIAALCQRAILLRAGRVVDEGPARQVVQGYLAGGMQEAAGFRSDGADAPGDDRSRLRGVRVCQPAGVPVARVDMQEPFDLEVEYDVYEPLRDFNVEVALDDESGDTVFRSWHHLGNEAITTVAPGRHVSRMRFPAGVLNGGQYWVSVGAHLILGPGLWALEQASRFEVEVTDPRITRPGVSSLRGPVGPAAVRWERDLSSETAPGAAAARA